MSISVSVKIRMACGAQFFFLCMSHLFEVLKCVEFALPCLDLSVSVSIFTYKSSGQSLKYLFLATHRVVSFFTWWPRLSLLPFSPCVASRPPWWQAASTYHPLLFCHFLCDLAITELWIPRISRMSLPAPMAPHTSLQHQSNCVTSTPAILPPGSCMQRHWSTGHL